MSGCCQTTVWKQRVPLSEVSKFTGEAWMQPPLYRLASAMFLWCAPLSISLSIHLSLSVSLTLSICLSSFSLRGSHSVLSLYVSLPPVSLIPSLTLSLYVSLSPSSLSLPLSGTLSLNVSRPVSPPLGAAQHHCGTEIPSLTSAALHNENKWAGSKYAARLLNLLLYTSLSPLFHPTLRWIAMPNVSKQRFMVPASPPPYSKRG